MSNLVEKIKRREARIAVIGLGYVGLPLAVEKAKAGFHVTGIDRNAERVARVNQGENYIPDILNVDLEQAVKAGRLVATQEFDVISDVDVITICVPTPLDKNKNPDTSFISYVVERSLPYLRPHQLLVLESTTYPGTTEEVILPQLQKRGFSVGKDYYLAFSPERVDPGNHQYKVKNTPKVVGGVTPACTEAAKALYETIVESEVFAVSSPRVAEMTKLLENIFRIVNVSLVNEMAMLCHRMGIDIWEVVEAAKTKPFGFMPFYPGPGMGGHCIPIDPFYLAWKAKEYDFSTRFIELAGEINDSMPEYVVEQVSEILNRHRKCLNGARILMLGMAYKKDTDDLRESPALKVALSLVERGAALSYHDPFIPACQVSGSELRSVEFTPARLRECDLVLITTDHSCVDYRTVAEHAPLVYDTRNAFSDHSNPRIYRLGAPAPGWRPHHD